ncbi:MAG: hypothetical protein ACK55I_27710, partial [bacterium]
LVAAGLDLEPLDREGEHQVGHLGGLRLPREGAEHDPPEARVEADQQRHIGERDRPLAVRVAHLDVAAEVDVDVGAHVLDDRPVREVELQLERVGLEQLTQPGG